MPVLILAITAAVAFSVFALQNPSMLWMLGLVVVIPAGLWLVRRPTAMLSTVMVSQAWAADLSGGGVVTPFKLALILLMAVTGIHVWRRGYVNALPRGLSISLLCLAMLIFLSELNSPYGGSASTLFELGSTVALYVIIVQLIQRPADLRVIGIAVAVNLVLMGIYVMLEVGWAPLTEGVVRAGGPPGQPNTLADNVARQAPFALGLVFDRMHGRWTRLLGSLAVGSAVYCEFAAASRAGTVGFVVGLAVFGFFVVPTVRARILTLVGLSAVVALMVLAAPKSFDQRVIGSVRSDEAIYKHTDVTSERLEHVQLAAKMIPNRPWLGYGRMGFTAVRQYQVGGRVQALHSSLFSILVAHGLPCAALYVGTILTGLGLGIRVLQRRWFRRHDIAALVAGSASGAVASTSSPELFSASLWCLICTLYVVHHLSRRRMLAESEDDVRVEPAPLLVPTEAA